MTTYTEQEAREPLWVRKVTAYKCIHCGLMSEYRSALPKMCGQRSCRAETASDRAAREAYEDLLDRKVSP